MKSKLRLFGAAVILYNLWLIGRFDIPGVSALVMTFGFAVAYEIFVVRSIRQKLTDHQEDHAASSAKPASTETPLPAPTPQKSIEDLAQEFGITRDGNKYRYKEFLYDKLADAVSYAKIDRARPVTCK